MEKVHADLPDKSFSKPSSGLTTVTVCADSGLLCTEACHADPRGDRAVSYTVASGTEPQGECTLHKMVDICTEGNCLAGEFCPEESIVQQGYLDYVREDYGESITASSATTTDPDDPNAGLDPSDPNWQPPDPNDPGTSTDPGTSGEDPSGSGEEPTEPDPTDPTGGFGDAGEDWWSGFWDSSTGT